MIKVYNTIKNNKLLAFVILTYLALAVIMPSKAIESFNNSMYYIKEMLIIMPVILILTSLIEAWVPKKTIQNTLGKDAGFKGYIFSFILGSFSAGPIYAAFPVCKALLNKGAKISNIVIILSTWAVIKIPMLANESKFLGLKFMILRWILTTIAIFLMAFIMERMLRENEVVGIENMDIALEIDEEKALSVDENYCIGCGICAKLSPENFVMENKKAKVTNNIYMKDENEKVNQAINKCPANAIAYKSPQNINL